MTDRLTDDLTERQKCNVYVRSHTLTVDMEPGRGKRRHPKHDGHVVS